MLRFSPFSHAFCAKPARADLCFAFLFLMFLCPAAPACFGQDPGISSAQAHLDRAIPGPDESMVRSGRLMAAASPSEDDIVAGSVPHEVAGLAQALSPRPTGNPPELTLAGTPLRIVKDEWNVVKSPGRLGRHDLRWLLPLAAATAATLATDTRVMRGTVSHDPGFNSSNATSSDVIRGVFIGAPIVLLGLGEIGHVSHEREAGLLAGEAMVNGYVTSEAIKYITLRERPYLDNARGYFFQTDAASDPSFVSGHAIVAWSSAAVLAGEYSRPWQQAVLYTAAAGLSVNRVLAQQHFPTDVLLGAASGWLIGHFVYRTHHRGNL